MSVKGRVIGIGGVFFKSARHQQLRAWYQEHLGFREEARNGVSFPWVAVDSGLEHRTVWCIFQQDTTYFDPSPAPLMINYIVDDLDAILERLAAEGVSVDPKRETDAAGRFGWIYDAEGNKIELWEPGKR